MTEAEFDSKSETVCEGLWIAHILPELKMDVKVPLNVTKERAEALSNNVSHHSQSKHIHSRDHFECDCVHPGEVSPKGWAKNTSWVYV